MLVTGFGHEVIFSTPLECHCIFNVYICEIYFSGGDLTSEMLSYCATFSSVAPTLWCRGLNRFYARQPLGPWAMAPHLLTISFKDLFLLFLIMCRYVCMWVCMYVCMCKYVMCVCVSMCMCKCVYVCIICVCVCAMYVMCVYVYVYVYVICVMCICDMCICRHMWMCVMCVWVCMLCLYVFMCKWMQVTQVPEEGRAVASSGAGVIDRCLWVARCGHLELTWALWYLSKLLIAEPSFLLNY